MAKAIIIFEDKEGEGTDQRVYMSWEFDPPMAENVESPRDLTAAQLAAVHFLNEANRTMFKSDDEDLDDDELECEAGGAEGCCGGKCHTEESSEG